MFDDIDLLSNIVSYVISSIISDAASFPMLNLWNKKYNISLEINPWITNQARISIVEVTVVLRNCLGSCGSIGMSYDVVMVLISVVAGLCLF